MRSLKRHDGINVVPFIDVLLVLLAIVFVISNFIALGKIDVNLASSATKDQIKEIKRNIVITKDHQLYLDDIQITKKEFSSKVTEFNSSDNIIITSDKRAVYEDFIFVVDLLKNNGLEKISMAVKK